MNALHTNLIITVIFGVYMYINNITSLRRYVEEEPKQNVQKELTDDHDGCKSYIRVYSLYAWNNINKYIC